MYKLKVILDAIIDYAYADSPKTAVYKRFYIEYLDKQLKSFNGDYHYSTRRIRIFTKGQNDTQIFKTSIHELAHHIDHIKNGGSGHKAPFYEIYRKLLYTAIDMQLFSIEDFSNSIRNSMDWNKVAKILQEYSPHPIQYKQGRMQIVVHNAFEIKDDLKAHGYLFNKISKSWEKEYASEDNEQELAFISKLTNDYECLSATAVSFQKSNVKLNYID